MKNLKEKYIELLLNKCIYSQNNQRSLFIYYDKINQDFIKDLIEAARKQGFKNILMDEKDIKLEHQLLQELSVEEIGKHPYFYNQKWNQALNKNCVFLLASTSFPNYLDDIDSEKIKAANEAKIKTQEKYFKRVMNDSLSWTIFPLSNPIWANKLFPKDPQAHLKLQNLIYSFCMLNNKYPIQKWNYIIDIEMKKAHFLNQLNIKELILHNSLGTHLTLGLAQNYIFRSLENNHCIENMPTYSFWTAPHKYHVEGIVYGSLPITYYGHQIEDYWFLFKNGKVIQYDALKGKKFLDDYFSLGDSYKRLGEIAITDYLSPIAKTKLNYFNNIIDENIGTHLALGSAYQNTILNGTNMSEIELDKAGCNVCPQHMDFTIGTNDLTIIAKTYDNKEFVIFKNGNFNYDLIHKKSPFI